MRFPLLTLAYINITGFDSRDKDRVNAITQKIVDYKTAHQIEDVVVFHGDSSSQEGIAHHISDMLGGKSCLSKALDSTLGSAQSLLWDQIESKAKVAQNKKTLFLFLMPEYKCLISPGYYGTLMGVANARELDPIGIEIKRGSIIFVAPVGEDRCSTNVYTPLLEPAESSAEG